MIAATANIERMRSHCHQAIDLLGTTAKGGQIIPMAENDLRISEMRGHVDKHVEQLKMIAAVPQGASRHKKQMSLAKKNVFGSEAGKVCAALRALSSWTFITSDLKAVSIQRVMGIAEAHDMYKPLKEPVHVRWEKKNNNGGFRLITAPGPLRKAQQIMLRDILLLMDIDNEFDFTRVGVGGEIAYRDEVIKNLVDKVNWWCSSDIKDCFPSIRPAHLKSLPVERRFLRTIVNLPKCAKIEVAPPEDAQALLQYLAKTYPDLQVEQHAQSLDVIACLSSVLARRGLPQGSCLSVLLARAFIGRELREALKDYDVRCLCWLDNLMIAGRAKAMVQAAQAAVEKRLLLHPAGPIKLHENKLQYAPKAKKISALGYDFLLGRGYKGSPVHVKPGIKRLERKRRRLWLKLDAAGPNTNISDWHQIAENYALAWYSGNRAWTKVPLLSKEVCLNITLSYVLDWRLHIPMGEFTCSKLPAPVSWKLEKFSSKV